MARRLKLLYNIDIKDYKSGGAKVEFSVFGIFSTLTTQWKYYAVSHINNRMTVDLCSTRGGFSNITVDNLRYGKEFTTKEDAIKFLQDFKIKWETGSNNTTSEIRDKKIDEIIKSKKS